MAEPSGTWSSFSEQNRLAWEEIADVRTHRWSSRRYTAEFFAAGGCSLDHRVVDAVGPLDAVRILHLPAADADSASSTSVSTALSSNQSNSSRASQRPRPVVSAHASHDDCVTSPRHRR